VVVQAHHRAPQQTQAYTAAQAKEAAVGFFGDLEKFRALER
jgi:hypothetical protein